MERRLLRAIMSPAMIATWIFGLAAGGDAGVVDWGGTAGSTSSSRRCWLLTWFHHWLARRRKDFAADRNRSRPDATG